MSAWNSVIVFSAAGLGCLTAMAISKVQARREENVAFQRELILGDRGANSDESTGVHTTGRVTVAELRARIDASPLNSQKKGTQP